MKFKAFEVILPSFICNRDCPYCTAKITRWKEVDFSLDAMKKKLELLKYKGYTFKYMILCGNGEPSMYDFETFKGIIDLYNQYRDMLGTLRIQSSGHIFKCKDKLDILPQDCLIELTRVYTDNQLDMNILRYTESYTEELEATKLNIRMNIVVLNNTTVEDLCNSIDWYTSKFKNINTFSIKTLNLNTKDPEQLGNKYSQWIMEHGLAKRDAMKFYPGLEKKLGKPEAEFDGRYVWVYKEKQVSLYVPTNKYGASHIVFYGDKLVDFSLTELNI